MRNKIKLLKLLIGIYLVVFVGTSQLAVAQAQSLPDPINTNRSQSELPQYNRGVDKTIAEYLCVPSDDNLGTALYDCLGRVYRFGVVAGALTLVFFVVWAGYLYITGGETGKMKGKSMIINCVVGMLLLLGSYTLLRFLNPDLVLFKPIQPPIFSGAGLPTCEAVGFGTNCIITSGPNTGQVYQGGSGGSGTSYGGKSCTPITNDASPASVNNLSKSCFGKYGAEVVKSASIVASSESGGNPSIPVGAGSCGAGKPKARCTGGEIPVWGLYQINLIVHKVGGLNCPAAFSGAAGGSFCRPNNQCTVVNKPLYEQCAAAAINATNNINVACELYAANIARGRPGFNDWGNTQNEHGKRCGF